MSRPLTASELEQIRSRNVLLLGVFLSAGLYLLPYEYARYLGWPLMLLSTYAHEMGHGLTALFLGGSFESFQMWPNGSGVARYAGDFGRLSKALVAAGGLVGPAMLGAILFTVARKPKNATAALYLIGIINLLLCLIVVRNFFGVVFVLLLGLLCLLVASQTSERTSQSVAVFLAVQLALSVYSRGDYLFTAVANTSAGLMPSDVAQMSEALFLPFWLWGAVCGIFSVLVLLLGLWLFLRDTTPLAPVRRAAQPTAAQRR